MKKMFIIFILFLLPIFLINAETKKISIKLKSASLIYNNSVGNDWNYGAWVNDNEIMMYQTLSLDIDSKDNLIFEVQAKEFDKRPDIGYQKKIIKISSLDLSKSNELVLEAIVTENAGRYSGNQAKWKFTFVISK